MFLPDRWYLPSVDSAENGSKSKHFQQALYISINLYVAGLFTLPRKPKETTADMSFPVVYAF